MAMTLKTKPKRKNNEVSVLMKKALKRIKPTNASRKKTIKDLLKKNAPVKDGLYYFTYPKGISIVLANGEKRTAGSFSGTVIFDLSGYNKVGEFNENWDFTRWTHMPGLSLSIKKSKTQK